MYHQAIQNVVQTAYDISFIVLLYKLNRKENNPKLQSKTMVQHSSVSMTQVPALIKKLTGDLTLTIRTVSKKETITLQIEGGMLRKMKDPTC